MSQTFWSGWKNCRTIRIPQAMTGCRRTLGHRLAWSESYGSCLDNRGITYFGASSLKGPLPKRGLDVATTHLETSGSKLGRLGTFAQFYANGDLRSPLQPPAPPFLGCGLVKLHSLRCGRRRLRARQVKSRIGKPCDLHIRHSASTYAASLTSYGGHLVRVLTHAAFEPTSTRWGSWPVSHERDRALQRGVI